MSKQQPIPVIDLFAGPGGLGEGFSAFRTSDRDSVFRIRLSIEKDPIAHQTLELRSFFRQFPSSGIPPEYYQYLRGAITRKSLLDAHRDAAAKAESEAWCAELGADGVPYKVGAGGREPNAEKPDSGTVSQRIRQALAGTEEWVLVGGPPCQAYSVAGRSRNKGVRGYRPEEDPKHYLYLAYLDIIARHAPTIFVMENVKGLLSSKLEDGHVFQRILNDLRQPDKALLRTSVRARRSDVEYTLYPIAQSPDPASERDMLFAESRPSDFVVESEKYGIPQARHRVLVLGIRNDVNVRPSTLSPASRLIPAWEVLNDMPPLRSGLSRTPDGASEWCQAIRGALDRRWLKSAGKVGGSAVRKLIMSVVRDLAAPAAGRGADFVAGKANPCYEADWFVDSATGGFSNHVTREHIAKDLHRYLYAACYATVHLRSPVLAQFPKDLLPNHKNVPQALEGGHFQERFRVQMKTAPATTITSHMAKDGHHFIHPDPSQCRSLTVREAARLQTFPDNYFFEGPRTSQYVQVGNAVPPLLARQIAGVVFDVFKKAGLAS